MSDRNACARCGHETALLRHPVRRLRWSRHWWTGVASIFGKPLRACSRCGALYHFDGRLLAAGAVETSSEMDIQRYRKDMVGLRDGFGTVVLASEIAVVWTLVGPMTYDPSTAFAAGAVGVAALVPFAYFARKVSKARKDLKTLRTTRKHGGLE